MSKKGLPLFISRTLAAEPFYKVVKKYWDVAYKGELESLLQNHQNAALRTLVWCVVVLSGGYWCWYVCVDKTTNPASPQFVIVRKMGKCTFNETWLDHSDFRCWLQAVPSSRYEARCKPFPKNLQLGTLGVKALESHARAEKHELHTLYLR